MQKYVEYNPNEHTWLRNLYVMSYNSYILDKIESLYERIEMCDDIYHRERLVRRIHKLKKKFIK